MDSRLRRNDNFNRFAIAALRCASCPWQARNDGEWIVAFVGMVGVNIFKE